MSRRHTYHQTGPIPVQYLVDYELVNGVVYDLVSGQQYNVPNINDAAVVTAGGSDWFYKNTTNAAIAANYIYDTGGGSYTNAAVFSHMTGVTWRQNEQTPDPPTNGVCPGYFPSGGLRWESEFYVKQSFAQMQFLLGDFKTNNTRQNGHFGFVVNCDTTSVRNYSASGGLKYCECANSYYTISYYQQFSNWVAPTATNPYTVILDFDEYQHRMKIIRLSDNVVLADSGVRSHPHAIGTTRLYALEHSTADSGHGRVVLAFHYIRLSESSYHSDFLQ